MIYTVTLNPALDKTVVIPSFTVDRVNRITKMRTDPGGKGINVSKVIQKLGGSSIACGLLGGHTGEAILSEVEKLGIETNFVFVLGETRSNLKIVDPVNHKNTDINEPGFKVSKELVNGLLHDLVKKVAPEDIVAISGSLPQGAPEDTYGAWVRALKEKGAKVFLDAEGEVLRNGMAKAPYLIKPNKQELSALFGRELKTVGDLKEAAQELIGQYGIEAVVASMGSEGALFVTKSESLYAKGIKVPAGSTAGAGDSIVAALAYAKEREMSLKEAVRLSTATAAATVMCSGSQAAEISAIEELMPRVEIAAV